MIRIIAKFLTLINNALFKNFLAYAGIRALGQYEPNTKPRKM